MGALGAFGMLAPIGETLAGIGNKYKEQQTQQDAQVKLLSDLVGSNPEYQPLLDYAKAGGTDVLPLLGGNVGKDITSAFQRQKWQQLLAQNTQSGGSQMDLINSAAQAGMFATPDEYFSALKQLQTPTVTTASLQQEVEDYLKNPSPRMQPDALARLQNMDLNNPAELLEAQKIIAPYSAPTPEKALHFYEQPVPDPDTGYNINWQHAQNPLTGEESPGFPKAVGIKLSAQQEQGLLDAHNFLAAVPEGQQAAVNMQARLDQLVKNGTIRPGGERQWMINQMRTYMADRKATAEEPWNPMAWGYYGHLGDVDDVFEQYATIMGQLQAQQAQPMKIFRSQGLFQQIAPHIPAPENLPRQNLTALAQAKIRFTQDSDYLRNLEQGLGLPSSPGAAWPTRGATPPAGGGGGGDAVNAALANRMRDRYTSPPGTP